MLKCNAKGSLQSQSSPFPKSCHDLITQKSAVLVLCKREVNTFPQL